jgi:polysaccharide export outer membrane protein
VPYVGRVHAAGLTIEALQDVIEDKLSQKRMASQPQVVVNIASNLSNTIIVAGDVRNPGRYPLRQAPERLLDAVAIAGSGNHAPFDTTITLTRGASQQSMTLGALRPLTPQNAVLEPGDLIHVVYEPRSYTVFGAALKPVEVTFDTERVTLAQAFARTSGLDDDKADPKGVYLFRYERAEVAKQLGVAADAPSAPLIYHIDLMNPTSYFLMQRFLMRDHDIIYVADARSNRIHKFLELLSAAFLPLGTAGSAANLAR